VAEICAVKVRAAEVRAVEICVVEICVDESRITKVRYSAVGIFSPAIPNLCSPFQDCQMLRVRYGFSF
jgi:hypothetical protein